MQHRSGRWTTFVKSTSLAGVDYPGQILAGDGGMKKGDLNLPTWLKTSFIHHTYTDTVNLYLSVISIKFKNDIRSSGR